MPDAEELEPTNQQSPGKIDRANKERLKKQLKVQEEAKEIISEPKLNEKRRRLDEIAFYPKHDPRTETPEYVKVHKKLAIEKDLPCLICGVRNSTLNDAKQNPYGARQMETHHHVIEWALANAIDPSKFNRILRPNLLHRHSETELYQHDMSAKEIADWVDHHEDNLWVLCDVHHRSKFFGIHEISFPIWGPMDILRPDFEQYVREHLKAALDEGTADEIARKPKTPKNKKKKKQAS
jgi:hypothetical protein